MNLGTTLGVALIMGLFGLAILIVLWPNEKSARKLLSKWGIPEPVDAEVAVAVQYLRRRRLWYPWLFLVLPIFPQATDIGLPAPNTTGSIGGALLLGGLLAELFAQCPSRGAQREAVLEHRGVLDFAPAWMLIISGIAELAGLGYVAGRAHWVLLVVAAASAAISWLILLLAVRRPAAGTRRVDLALRCRSARVALGLGIGAVAMISWNVNDIGTFAGFIVSLLAFLTVTSPPRKLPPIAARAV